MTNTDKISNGMIFGALFGVLLLLYAQSPGSFLVFLSDGLTSLTNLIPVTIPFVNYLAVIIIGGIIGAWIDAK